MPPKISRRPTAARANLGHFLTEWSLDSKYDLIPDESVRRRNGFRRVYVNLLSGK